MRNGDPRLPASDKLAGEVRVKVLFFGMLKDIVGQGGGRARSGPNGATLGSVFDHYGSRYPRMREMAGSILLARNQEFASATTQIASGDEIAFLPPVSGGSGLPQRDLRKRELLRSDLASDRHRARSPIACCGERTARW